MNELAVREKDFFSTIVSKPATDISRQDMTKVLLALNDLNGGSARSIDSRWAAHIASTLPFSKVVAMQMRFSDCNPMVLADRFLREAFAHLDSFGVSYDIGLHPDKKGEDKIGDIAKASRKSGLEGQADYYETEYARLQGLRRLFAIMDKNGLITGPDFVIPMEHLDETLMAEPVWFIGSRHKMERQPIIQRFCTRFSAKEGADLFQLYNWDIRTLAAFDGRETVPAPIMEVMAEGLNFFDQVVITTPYREMASDVWRNPARFIRPSDPEVFGFMNGKPFFVRLGRWSGTGFLARKCDQIAETILHLTQSVDFIRIFFLNPHHISWFVTEPGVRTDAGRWRNSYFGDNTQHIRHELIPQRSVGKVIDYFTPYYLKPAPPKEQKRNGFFENLVALFRF
jgi:hypothetical protein